MTPHERVKFARIAAGYSTATEAARAMGVKPSTYIHHENGRAGLARAGQRYAQFFRVDYGWLMTGRGEMRGRAAADAVIPVDGLVGAGGVVETTCRERGGTFGPGLALPNDRSLGAFIIRGDAGKPRFLDGETILYDRVPAPPESLIGRIAIVQLADGRKLVRILRRGPDANRWRLECCNGGAATAARGWRRDSLCVALCRFARQAISAVVPALLLAERRQVTKPRLLPPHGMRG